MTNTCDAKIRPFPTPTEVACEQAGEHDTHAGAIHDYAYPGSETTIRWLEGDRRNYHGEWPGACDRCILPLGHHGNHEA